MKKLIIFVGLFSIFNANAAYVVENCKMAGRVFPGKTVLLENTEISNIKNILQTDSSRDAKEQQIRVVLSSANTSDGSNGLCELVAKTYKKPSKKCENFISFDDLTRSIVELSPNSSDFTCEIGLTLRMFMDLF